MDPKLFCPRIYECKKQRKDIVNCLVNFESCHELYQASRNLNIDYYGIGAMVIALDDISKVYKV